MKIFFKGMTLIALMLVLTSCTENAPMDFDDQGAAPISDGVGDTLSEKMKSEAGDRVFFRYDSSELDSNSVATLNRQIAWIRSNNIKSITIEGRCDERGTREYNLGLGERRANAVAEYMHNALPNVTINVVSYGKDRPIEVSNASIEEAYRQNRVAVTVVG